MFSDEPFCRVCQRREHSLMTTPWGAKVCAACAVQTGAFILRAPEDVVRKHWSITAVATVDTPSPLRPADSPDEQQRRLDRAMKFLQNGLDRDALVEVAAVLAGTPKPEVMEKAVALVFGKRLAFRGLADRLSKLLFKE